MAWRRTGEKLLPKLISLVFIIWTKAYVCIFGPTGSNFSDFLNQNAQTLNHENAFEYIPSAKWRQFCLDFRTSKLVFKCSRLLYAFSIWKWNQSICKMANRLWLLWNWWWGVGRWQVITFDLHLEVWGWNQRLPEWLWHGSRWRQGLCIFQTQVYSCYNLVSIHSGFRDFTWCHYVVRRKVCRILEGLIVPCIIWILFSALPINCIESPYRYYCFASQLVEIYANVNWSPLTILYVKDLSRHTDKVLWLIVTLSGTGQPFSDNVDSPNCYKGCVSTVSCRCIQIVISNMSVYIWAIMPINIRPVNYWNYCSVLKVLGFLREMPSQKSYVVFVKPALLPGSYVDIDWKQSYQKNTIASSISVGGTGFFQNPWLGWSLSDELDAVSLSEWSQKV